MATELRPDETVAEENAATAAEHRRFIELLREGYEDVKAGRMVTAEEAQRRAEVAIARGSERHSRRGRPA